VIAAPLFESCIDSLDSAIASARGGAGRVELCARLDVGGTTPGAALIAQCAAAVRIPVFAIIRPRGGDFVYGAGEVAAMVEAIGAATRAGAHGVVFGALRRDGTIDRETMRRLVDAARPLPVTCHKAIDAARDPLEALDALLDLGIDRVLTSGGAETAIDGAGVIADMVALSGDALVVMAGGGIRAGNVAEVVRRTGVREVHAKLLPIARAAAADERTLAGWAEAISAVVGVLRTGQG
jgi:copper homeostasis protein